MSAPDIVVCVDLEAARVARAFLPRNPSKLRTASPETREAVRKFIAALEAAIAKAEGRS